MKIWKKVILGIGIGILGMIVYSIIMAIVIFSQVDPWAH